MTKRELISILKSAIKDGWMTFKDPSDAKDALACLKEGDLDCFFRNYEDAIATGLNIFDDIRDEAEGLED
jgi:hypothetical protein